VASRREQRDRAWKTSKAVEEKVVDEIRRHCELFVEDLEVARCEQTMALAEAERASVARRSESEGPDGFGLTRPRMRARVFYQWPAQLDSAGVSACKTTGHARAGQEPRVHEQRKLNP
jgi:hypothetical protein